MGAPNTNSLLSLFRPQEGSASLPELIGSTRTQIREGLAQITNLLAEIREEVSYTPDNPTELSWARSGAAVGVAGVNDLEVQIPASGESWLIQLVNATYDATQGVAPLGLALYRNSVHSDNLIWAKNNVNDGQTVNAFSTPLSSVFIPEGTNRLIARFAGVTVNTVIAVNVQVQRERRRPMTRPPRINPGG